MSVAWLSSQGQYSVFKCNNRIIRFRSPKSLEHYAAVKEWDNGYLVVMAKYAHNAQEEYIDLVPILQYLYINPQQFLENVDEVRIDE